MKHRKRGKQGLKYEHAMIKGLRGVLEEIQGWAEVSSVFPGRIRHAGGSGGIRLAVSVHTMTGIKVLAHSGGAVQEVFIVTSGDKTKLAARIKQEFG